MVTLLSIPGEFVLFRFQLLSPDEQSFRRGFVLPLKAKVSLRSAAEIHEVLAR